MIVPTVSSYPIRAMREYAARRPAAMRNWQRSPRVAMIVALPARAGWVGDAIDLMGTRGLGGAVGRRRGPRPRPRGGGTCAEYRRIDRDEHVQARQRDLARQRACGRSADGDRRRVVLARRALARAFCRRAAARSTSPTTASATCTTSARTNGRRDAQIAERLSAHRLSARRARSRRAYGLLQDRGVRINLGGIAKGYAVERAAAMLRDTASSTRCSMRAATRA